MGEVLSTISETLIGRALLFVMGFSAFSLLILQVGSKRKKKTSSLIDEEARLAIAEKRKTTQEDSSKDSASALMKILDLPPPPSAKIRANIAPKTPETAASTSVSEVVNSVKTPAPPKPALAEAVAGIYGQYLKDLQRLSEDLGQASAEKEILVRACKNLSSACQSASVVFLEYQAAQRALMVTARSAATVFAGTQPKMLLAIPKEAAASQETIRGLFEGLQGDRELQTLLNDASYLENQGQVAAAKSPVKWWLYPLVVRGSPRGVFAIKNNSTCHRDEFSTYMGIATQLIASSIESSRLHTRIQELNVKDHLTNIYSKKYFHERLYEQFLLSQRLKHPLTVTLFELDFYSAIVKQYGAGVGDAVIKEMTRTLQKYFRKSDILARYDQATFAVLMPHTAVADAIRKVDKVCQLVQAASLKFGPNESVKELKVTLSAGMVEYPSHTDNPSDLVRFAKEALAQAKAKARGQIVLSKVPQGYIAPFNSRFIRSAPVGAAGVEVAPVQDL